MKHARIEYTSKRIPETDYIYVFRDVDKNVKCRFNYQNSIELDKSGYTVEGFGKNKNFFGVYVLQSNGAMASEDVFSRYKKRWGIETFCQYLKNCADFNDIMFQDYYKEQAFSFIMLIVGQIHQKMMDAVKLLHDNTISIRDVLFMAMYGILKIPKRGILRFLQSLDLNLRNQN